MPVHCFYPTVSYITRRCLDVTTITAINRQGAVETQPPAIGSHSPYLQQRCLWLTLLRLHFKHGTPTT